MFDLYLFNAVNADFYNKIILYDKDHLLQLSDYLESFKQAGFQIIYYKNDLEFRKLCGKSIHDSKEKLLIIVDNNEYIPYDILRISKKYPIKLSNFFDGLTMDWLNKYSDANLDLIALALENILSKPDSKEEIKNFFEKEVFNKNNLTRYIATQTEKIQTRIIKGCQYKDWFIIAKEKAEIDRLSAHYRLNIDTSTINRLFSDWVIHDFGKLSAEYDKDSPVLISNTMEFIKNISNKFVIVVMDGMSEFDWSILKTSFWDIKYTKASLFAMIPTVTSVSRQCLLSNKHPINLQNPWSQQKEENEFRECAKELGFKENQISYCRGYDNELKPSIKCAAVIVNDIDDMVHGQTQERLGMYNGLSVMAQNGQLARMVNKYIKQGFDIFITADHGNTPCTGIGGYRGAGVETTTKSRRMMVLNDLGDKESLMGKYPLIEYPKYYLDKKYTYLICEGQASYDCKDETVMSHGGITLDEVVVPFIKVMARDNNG